MLRYTINVKGIICFMHVLHIFRFIFLFAFASSFSFVFYLFICRRLPDEYGLPVRFIMARALSELCAFISCTYNARVLRSRSLQAFDVKKELSNFPCRLNGCVMAVILDLPLIHGRYFQNLSRIEHNELNTEYV